MSSGVYKHNNKGTRNGKYVHGMYKTRFYRIFWGIKYRIGPSYKRIKCLWKTFRNFKDDMYDSYLEHVKKFGERQTTIDRINFRDNYFKENCRWATYKQQNRNHSKNILINIGGKTKCIAEWAEIYNIDKLLVYNRLKRSWSAEKALTHAKVPKGKRTI